MAEIDEINRETLNPRQQQLYDDIMRTRPRGKLSGPFSVWMHTPDIAEPANGLANCFRVNAKLDKRLIELIVLLMCRSATVQYAWSVHEPLARQAGLTQQTVDAVRARKRPDLKREDERVVYDLVTELVSTKRLSDANFRARQSGLGPRRCHRGRELRRLLRHDRVCAQRLRSAAAAGRRCADVETAQTTGAFAFSNTARPRALAKSCDCHHSRCGPSRRRWRPPTPKCAGNCARPPPPARACAGDPPPSRGIGS